MTAEQVLEMLEEEAKELEHQIERTKQRAHGYHERGMFDHELVMETRQDAYEEMAARLRRIIERAKNA